MNCVKKTFVMLGSVALMASAGLISAPAFANADNMVIAMPQVPLNLEPMGSNNNVQERVMYSIFETLIRSDQFNGKLSPGLATKWERVSPSTVRFHLRQGVKFHDGSDFTADDVVTSFGPERFMDPKAPGRGYANEFLGNLKEIRKIDKYTVEVEMKTSDPIIERRFSSRMSEIVCGKCFKAAGSWDQWIKAPIGTGPYKVVSYKNGDRVVLARFDEYWGKKAPAKQITFVEVPELSARVAGLRSNQFDLITEVPPDQVKVLNKGNIDIVGGPTDNVYSFVFDDKSSPVLANPKLRQAFSYAVDRDLLVKLLFNNMTIPANSFQSKTFGDFFIAKYERNLYDLNKAKELVKESGYKGEPIIWRIQPGYYTLEMTATQAIVGMLKKAGLNVQIAVKENWSQVEAAGKDRMMNNASISAYYPDPSSQLWRRTKPTSYWPKQGYWLTDSPVYQEYCKLGNVLDTSTDQAERKAAWEKMLGLFEQDPVAVPLYQMPMIYAKQKSVNWKAGTLGRLDLSADNLSFAK